MQETLTELASKARIKASRLKNTISEYAQTAAGTAMNGAKRGAETATTVLDQNGDGSLDQEDVKIMADKGFELGKTGAKELKKAAIWAASIDSVKRSIGGAVVGALVFGFVGLILPGSFFFLGAKVGLILGAVLGFLRK